MLRIKVYVNVRFHKEFHSCIIIILPVLHFLLSCSKFAVQRKALFDDLKVFGNIRNGKDFKTFFTVMNYGHGDIQVAHKICKFVTDCFSLQPG